MLKTIKKVILGSISILGVSFCIWTCLLLNPNLVYAESTLIDGVTIYHNSNLDPDVKAVVNDALQIIKSSELYSEEFHIKLCLNDESLYPKLYPFAGAAAYAFLDKTVMYACTPNFKENTAEFKWEVNNFESRKLNLTNLIAHEFTHNLQYFNDPKYYVTSTMGRLNWKFEGHAEYISRQFKNDGKLKNKISQYLSEIEKEHSGIPVFQLDDGTIQNLSYYKYALVVQYLLEVQHIDFNQLCNLQQDFEILYDEMIAWNCQ